MAVSLDRQFRPSAVVLPVELPHDAGEVLEQASRDRRHLGDHPGEVALVDHEQVTVGVADHRGRPRAVIEEAQLADDRAGAERGDSTTVPFHGDRSIDDHERLTTGLPLVDDHRASGHSHLGPRPGDEPELLLGAGGKERDIREMLQMLVTRGHSGTVALSPSSPPSQLFGEAISRRTFVLCRRRRDWTLMWNSSH